MIFEADKKNGGNVRRVFSYPLSLRSSEINIWVFLWLPHGTNVQSSANSTEFPCHWILFIARDNAYISCTGQTISTTKLENKNSKDSCWSRLACIGSLRLNKPRSLKILIAVQFVHCLPTSHAVMWKLFSMKGFAPKRRREFLLLLNSDRFQNSCLWIEAHK